MFVVYIFFRWRFTII